MKLKKKLIIFLKKRNESNESDKKKKFPKKRLMCTSLGGLVHLGLNRKNLKHIGLPA
jgi:hypothetical protein